MRVTERPQDMIELSRDAGMLSMTPKVAFYAESEDEVSNAIREAVARGFTVTARGGGTSIPSQSVGEGAILLQPRSSIEVRGGSVVCSPGMVKADLNRELASAGRWMPVDPSSYASATLGGMISNNSSGARTVKYGSTIDYVDEVKAVMSDGSAQRIRPMPLEEALSGAGVVPRAASLLVENRAIIEEERPKVTKNSSGYRLERVVRDGVFDFPKLFVGSEGTLCVFTEGTLKTRQTPGWRLLFIVESTLDELDGITATFRDLSPSALELVDKSVFRVTGKWDRVSRYSRTDDPYLVFSEFDGDTGDPTAKMEEVASSRAGAADPMVLTSPAEIAEAMDVRSETLRGAQDIKKGGRSLVPGVEDLVVPTGRLSDLVGLLVDVFGRRGLEYISYGHAGDANLHARPFLDMSEPSAFRTLEELMDDCFEAVWKMGGSMTGEHGDGMLRAKYVERQYPKTYWIMREVKSLFDPRGVLNPGVKIAQ